MESLRVIKAVILNLWSCVGAFPYLFVLCGIVQFCLSPCPVYAANPSTIYVYPFGSTHGETFMASLSGVVARTSPEVFMAVQGSDGTHDPEFWLREFIADNPGTNVVWQNSLPFYIDRYKDKLSGYVLYNNASINEATSVAGALGAVMVHETLLPSISVALGTAGIAQVEDVRGRNSTWVYSNYGGMLNKNMIFRQMPSFNQQLRSLAVLNSGFMFYETGAARDAFLAGQNDHTRVFGWGYGNSESEFFGSASVNNLMGVPADHLSGSAAPARWEVAVPSQPAHTPADTPTDPNKHYVAFVMSDGDNVQWLTNDFARSTRWFGSTYRGEFDFTFDMSPSLLDVNPVALKYFYDEAASDENKTFFVSAGGWGLNYPSATPDIAGFMDATVAAMQAVDQNIISVLDDSGFNLAKLQQMVARPEILGMMLKTGPAYAGQNGAIHWHDGKPIVSVKYTLWDGFDTPNEIIAALNNAPVNPLHDQSSYSIVNVHPWSTSTAGGGTGNPMTNVKYIVDNLDTDVEVVTLEELIIHLRNNHGTLVDNPIGQNIVLNGSFEIPASGNPSRPANWFYAAAPGATQLVNGMDSTGEGSKAAAINQANADWRSAQMEVQAGEQLTFSFDFMFNGVPSGSRFRADARFFTQSNSFVGETVQFLDAANYAAGVWHNFTTAAVVPAGASIGDIRFSTFFGPFAGGQVLIDDVQLLRNVAIPGDYNADQKVDAADYVVWRKEFGHDVVPGLGADGNRDGVVNELDYAVWRVSFGNTSGSAQSIQELIAPEPTGTLLCAVAAALTALRG
ncbi:MAG TPA: dockerin type I domain-containing protein, partial [Lacipirellulaceae bacterium]|nr:dockerin type I domain-containing protein [Lacipirellulaceae bacterium]